MRCETRCTRASRDMERRFAQMGVETDGRFGQMATRFEQVDARFEQVDARFEQVDRRFEQVERHLERIDSRFEVLEHRLTATFRGELNAAITAQTRTVMFSMLGSIVSVGTLAVVLQQLG